MKSYRVYLTKSFEVAGLIAEAHRAGENGVTRVSHSETPEYHLIIA